MQRHEADADWAHAGVDEGILALKFGPIWSETPGPELGWSSGSVILFECSRSFADGLKNITKRSFGPMVHVYGTHCGSKANVL